MAVARQFSGIKVVVAWQFNGSSLAVQSVERQ